MPEKTLVKEASVESTKKDTLPSDPLSKVQTLIDRKIRNLEKRKGKLESYKKEKKDGKKLDAHQTKALDKYDDVLENLEFLKDFSKSVIQIQDETLKEKKKQDKKEFDKRFLEEKEKFKNLLIFQEIFRLIDEKGPEFKNELIKGSDALKPIKEQRLNNILSLKEFVLPNGSQSNETLDQIYDASTNKIILLLEGRRKEAVKGTTFAEAKETLLSIHKSGILYSRGSVQTIDNVQEPVEQSVNTREQSGQAQYSFGTVGGVEGAQDPLHDPAVVSMSTFGTNGSITSQIYTNTSYTYNAVPVVAGGYIANGQMMPPTHFTQNSHPDTETLLQPQLTNENNNLISGIQDLSEGQQKDSEFRAKDGKRQRFHVQGNRREGGERKHFDHHGASNGFQRRQDRYQGNKNSAGFEGKKSDRPNFRSDRQGFTGKPGPKGERQFNGPPKSGGHTGQQPAKQWA